MSADPAADLLTEAADEVFAALADRTRRRVLVRLAQKPDDAGAVARDLGVSRQAARTGSAATMASRATTKPSSPSAATCAPPQRKHN